MNENGEAPGRPELLHLLKLPGPGTVHAGPDASFTGQGCSNPAAQAIIEAAQRQADLPTVLVCAGPLTNVADALLREPAVASTLTLAWVGGAARNEEEYN